MTGTRKVAVVTGANRGIGFETCRQLAKHGMKVVLAARDEAKGRAAAERLRDEDLDVDFAPLDVSDDASGVMQAKIETLRRTMEVNVYGALRVTQALLPLMPKEGARIINVSSGMGQLAEMNGGWPGYRISKTSLNALTRIFADELKETGIRVNAICPGWVKTDMGGAKAPRTPQQGADTVVWLATEREVPTGGFFRDRKPIPW